MRIAEPERPNGVKVAPNEASGEGTALAKYERLLDQICDDGSFKEAAIDNSSVVLKTDAVDQVIAEGLRIVPFIIARMRQPEVDFDFFVHYYTAAMQILRQAGTDMEIWWQGGARIADFERLRLGPGSQSYDEEFRKRVIDSIQAAYESITGQQ